tara:strand:- start:5461 stop:5757 length:297 start_codon:yes stop_codon:yes gene_type:complete
MRTLPKYVRIGGHVIRVQKIPGLIADQEAFGMWHDDKLEIQIDDGLSSSLEWDVFWHEVTEAVNSLCDFKLEHHVIQTFGLLLHQVFQSMSEKGQRDA